MSALKNITAGIVGSLALFGFANAAMVSIAGHNVYEENFADSAVEKTGTLLTYDIGGATPTADEAVGGDMGDGVRCDVGGCSFMVGFSGGIINEAGNDLIIFGLGGGGPELFDIAYNGVRLTDMQMVGTGMFEGAFEIFYLELNLDALGVAVGDVISEIKIIVNNGSSTEEFALFASMNDVAVPLPAAVWLFGSALAFGGGMVRRKKKAAIKA